MEYWIYAQFVENSNLKFVDSFLFCSLFIVRVDFKFYKSSSISVIIEWKCIVWNGFVFEIQWTMQTLKYTQWFVRNFVWNFNLRFYMFELLFANNVSCNGIRDPLANRSIFHIHAKTYACICIRKRDEIQGHNNNNDNNEENFVISFHFNAQHRLFFMAKYLIFCFMFDTENGWNSTDNK